VSQLRPNVNITGLHSSDEDALELSAGANRPGGGAVLFEFAWEVCNQVGGIYQVIRSKAPSMIERWGDRYCLVGPYDANKAQLEFEPTRPSAWISRAINSLKAEGLTIHHGRWLVTGRPRVMLIEPWQGLERLAAVKYELWEHHGVETPGNDRLINDVVAFADAARRLLKALCDHRNLAPGATPGVVMGAGMGETGGTGRAASATKVKVASSPPIVAHFHEWMGGLAIPMVRRQNLPVATVFTTHATLLGRYVASGTDNFYDALPWMDQAALAVQYNVKTQHSIERACAHGSHVFTTVSSVTAEECAALLGRGVDVVTPNGLNVERYNMSHDQQRLHAQSKEAIHRFVLGHFFPSYSFDLDRTLYFFTSGRFEPRNKGFDLCLEAMARLNAEMKASADDPRFKGGTIVFFIVSSRPTKSLNPLALEKRGVLEELHGVCRHITDTVGEKLSARAASGGKLKLDDLVDEYWMLRYRRTQQALRQHCLPMVVTHIMEDDQNDPVLNQLRMLGLVNRPEDPVKIVYHPEFINPVNPLWGIEYDQFVRGCHLGLFPSAYEPWGYTPLECAAMGIPAVTSDLAGFGRYTQENIPEHDKQGLIVLNRRGRSYHDAAADLAGKLLEYCRQDRRDRIQLRNAVDRLSWEFDWPKLVGAYHGAHDLALERAGLAAPAAVS